MYCEKLDCTRHFGATYTLDNGKRVRLCFPCAVELRLEDAPTPGKKRVLKVSAPQDVVLDSVHGNKDRMQTIRCVWSRCRRTAFSRCLCRHHYSMLRKSEHLPAAKRRGMNRATIVIEAQEAERRWRADQKKRRMEPPPDEEYDLMERLREAGIIE